MQYGFIGVGQMGGGLARNLIRAKKNVWVFDLNPEAVKTTLAAGTTGRAAAKIEELAQADVVFTSLPLPQHLESVMLGPKGLLSQMQARRHLHRRQHDRPRHGPQTFGRGRSQGDRLPGMPPRQDPGPCRKGRGAHLRRRQESRLREDAGDPHRSSASPSTTSATSKPPAR